MTAEISERAGGELAAFDELARKAAAWDAQQASEPVAYVPIHPIHGALWANTVDTLDADRPSHYPVRPIAFADAAPQAAAPKQAEAPGLTEERAVIAACTAYNAYQRKHKGTLAAPDAMRVALSATRAIAAPQPAQPAKD
ncbi:hypothetical protein D7S86_08350 [Pararobbsia silviterrae]|uniref:Uncharacterized protein n=2 Tax=Pararobbsia silviterrae TaxID=1792498 RepID=A0A494Y0U6_9BURK|nr:hypothetical protein D7S86_08350 [Pararobbsia silviterrae]